MDAAIAAAVTAAQIGVTYAGSRWHPENGPVDPLAYIPLAVGGASLLDRRRYPVGVLAVTLAATLWASGENAHGIYLALIVAFFTAVLARKRAAAIAATVRVSCGDGALIVEIDDDGVPRAGGRGPSPGSRRQGNGIAGMTERAKVLGGTLQAGPRPDGGFRVRAQLPVEGRPGEDPPGEGREP